MLDLETIAQLDATATSSVSRQANLNCRQNLAILRQIQPNLVASRDLQNLEWIFARDGSLSALQDGKWWGGCSVPAKAARELLRTLHITAPVAGFLSPTHPAQIAYALAHLKMDQAIIAILPRAEDLLLTLHCHDFSRDIAAHRLWFVAGDAWPDELAKILHSNLGLPIPQQFIRTALLCEDASAPLIATAQKIFTDELHRRGNLLSELRQTRAQNNSRITLAAHMHFRLWDDAGAVLQELIGNELHFDCTTIDFDDPVKASPLALAQAAAESRALIMVNLTRADCGQFIHPQTPIVSWLTTRPIPAFDPTWNHDKLLLPDPSLLQIAKQSNWPADRLALLPWRRIAASINANEITIIADTRPIDPAPAFDLSSHQLLWDLIRAEIHDDPTLLKNDIVLYLHSRMKRLNVSESGLDQRRFIEDLLIPAYQQSIARHLLKAKIPVKIFGHGWQEISEFQTHTACPISSRQQLEQALSTTAALIHVWPTAHPHPIDTAGPPVIRLTSRGMAGLIADARLATAGKLIKPAPPAADSIHKATLAHIFRAVLAE